MPSGCNRIKETLKIDLKLDLKSFQIEKHIQTRNDERQQTSLHYDLKNN